MYGMPNSAMSPRSNGAAAPPLDPRCEDLHHVACGVWIGSHYVLRTSKTLLARGIRNVVNAAIEFITENPELIAWDELKRNGIEVYNTMWDDTLAFPIFPSASMETAVKLIDDVVKQGKNVLVNCAQGKSRSTSLVIAYLMARQGWSYDEALAACKRARPQVQPNANFERQLRQLEASLRSTLPVSSPPASPLSSHTFSPARPPAALTSVGPQSPTHAAHASPRYPAASPLGSPTGRPLTHSNSLSNLTSPPRENSFGSFSGLNNSLTNRGPASPLAATVTGTGVRNPFAAPNNVPGSPAATPPQSPFAIARPPASPRVPPPANAQPPSSPFKAHSPPPLRSALGGAGSNHSSLYNNGPTNPYSSLYGGAHGFGSSYGGHHHRSPYELGGGGYGSFRGNSHSHDHGPQHMRRRSL